MRTNMVFNLENYIIKAFLASGLLAMIMMLIALGLIYLSHYGSPLSGSIILVMAAISFVLSSSFFERYEVGSIELSMVVSIIITLLLILASGGIIYSVSMNRQSWEELLSGLAICLI
ncbi:MAG: hypothetical protein LUQ22_07305, partial [Methanotrichaceae archaeon]|nr:hypothetical protein [Methanotrichaceae archaeon]